MRIKPYGFFLNYRYNGIKKHLKMIKNNSFLTFILIEAVFRKTLSNLFVNFIMTFERKSNGLSISWVKINSDQRFH